MEEIASRVNEVNTLVRDVARASQEQSHGVDEMNGALAGLQGTTQQNASMVQEAAHAAVLLKEDAARLFDLVDRFRVEGAASVDPGQKAVNAPAPKALGALPRPRPPG